MKKLYLRISFNYFFITSNNYTANLPRHSLEAIKNTFSTELIKIIVVKVISTPGRNLVGLYPLCTSTKRSLIDNKFTAAHNYRYKRRQCFLITSVNSSQELSVFDLLKLPFGSQKEGTGERSTNPHCQRSNPPLIQSVLKVYTKSVLPSSN